MIGIVFGVVMWLHAGASIHWRGDYDHALVQARTLGKVLMVLAVEPNSASCNQFLTRMRGFPKMIDQVNSRWVSVIVTHDHRSDYPNELFYTTQFPALFWVDPRDERFVTSPVMATPETLQRSLANVKPLRRQQ